MSRRLDAMAVAVALLACAVPVTTRTTDTQKRFVIRRVALIPFETGTPFAAAENSADWDAATRFVGATLFEALREHTDFDLVPPAQAGPHRVVGVDRGDDTENVQRALQVDGVLFGTLRRWRVKEGGARGARRPAAAAFDVELRGPGGLILWTGTYDEQQRPLSKDLLSFGRARSRGFKFVPVEELARYGAGHLAEELANASDRWR